jgi:hypothetical protein
LKFLIKASLPPTKIFGSKFFWKKYGIFENFDFFAQKMTFFHKTFGTSRDFHKSDVTISKKPYPPAPPPGPPKKIPKPLPSSP